MIALRKDALPAGTEQGAGNAGVEREDDRQQCATHGAVVNGQGMRAYEDAKALLARNQPELTPAEYAAACREAARKAGV